MPSFKQDPDAFRRLPLNAQLALLLTIRFHPETAADVDYIEQLKRIHAECLAVATPEQKQAYDREIAQLFS